MFKRLQPTSFFALLALSVGLTVSNPVFAADSAQSQMQAYAKEAASTPSSARGKTFFVSKHGGEWSCSSCHGEPPTGQGKHASTGKAIAPMAPAFNPDRFTDSAKTEKWFRRNCGDVLSRACTPAEKADVLAYLISVK